MIQYAYAQLYQHNASTPEAAERAQATLTEHCSERQRADLSGGSVLAGPNNYDIKAYSTTAALVTRGTWQATVGTRMSWLPAADCMLAAKLLLEADEAAFVRAGNKCGNIWLD